MSSTQPKQKIYGLSTARAGSKSVKNKNIMMIRGKPLYLHNLLESMETPEIVETFISTDIPQVIEDASKYGYSVIVRPDELCQDSSTHTDTIYHGLLAIEEITHETIDYLVIMLGNTINMDRNITSEAVKLLNEDDTLDSVITVVRANHFNPIRAYVDDNQGENAGQQILTTYLSQDQIKEKLSQMDIADKNSVGNIYFQNGLWICRRDTIIKAKEENKGLYPFLWFGDKIKYLEQEPWLQEIDDEYQVKLLS